MCDGNKKIIKILLIWSLYYRFSRSESFHRCVMNAPLNGVCVWLLVNCILRVLTQELQAFDSPQLITLIDGVRDDNQICVGYKNQFDLINEKNGDTLQLYQVEANKVNPVILVVINKCQKHLVIFLLFSRNI